MANLLLAVFTAMRSSGSLGKPSKRKNFEILDIVQREGGVSTAAKLFIEEKYGHVYRGGVCRSLNNILFLKWHTWFKTKKLSTHPLIFF